MPSIESGHPWEAAEIVPMGTRLRLCHHTSYDYNEPRLLGPQTIRLRPAPHSSAQILSYKLTVLPAAHVLKWHQDPVGNHVARATFQAPVRRFVIASEIDVALLPVNPFDFLLDPEVAVWPFRYPAPLEQALAPFRRLDTLDGQLAALVVSIPCDERPTIDVLADLARLIQGRIVYRIRLAPGVQTPEETLIWASGSCRDSAWLLVHLLRYLGFAARFVSGYLVQVNAGLSGDAPAADTLALHAWAEAYLPGAGWIGLDTTSGLLTGEGHIPLAATISPESAAPITGTTETGAVTFTTHMSVTRLDIPGAPVRVADDASPVGPADVSRAAASRH